MSPERCDVSISGNLPFASNDRMMDVLYKLEIIWKKTSIRLRIFDPRAKI